LTNAHARAILYFSPPDSYDPAAPTFVSMPSGSLSIIFFALALFKAITNYSSVAPGLQ